ncbi:ensconsin isoform X15 [Nasonia vitripennis]|uniref:Ensconsin n=1 Tax=Nasonia vitripennis TaxID=7425 RepID=A0A7M7TEP4_NASVI|nr:ensconsin isoform X15 [Nasonia vitripennis]
MFSELCRETLRKAAVCYSSGRSSASPSPSPPSSPPPSPSKEPATSSRSHHHHHHHHQPHHQQHHHHHHHSSEATIETRDVGCSSRAQSAGDHHQQDAAGGSHFSRRSTSPPEIREKRAATPTNVSSGRRTSGLESRDGRRAPYAVTVDYSSSSARESSSQQQYHSHQHHHQQYHQHHQHHYQCHRRGRSASPEMLRSFSYEEQSSQQHSPGSSPEPDDNSSTSGDEAGAANDENGQRSSSAHNRHSLTKGRESTGGGASAKDLDRAKLVRDRQNEERQRKLEELRQQALAAQKFREQREEERRKRIEELRTKDYDRRSQVEERKRLIWEAERERREAILRKNQEREARIEAKRKNERSHIVFAFGSSTPRMLEPADTGGATFWGTRRATSTTNVMMFSAAQPLTRRSSERELDGSKKRATSAGGLDRKPGEGIRSGEATPNSPSRPHSSMSQQSGTSSVASSSVNLRPRTGTPRRPRPASIAGTGVSVSSSVERNNTTNDTKAQKDSKPPLPKVHSSSTPKKPSATSTPTSAKSASASTAERKSSAPGTTRSARASPRVTPRATPLQSPGVEHPPVLQLDPKQKSEEKEVLDEKPQQVSQESRVTEPVQVEAKKEEKPEELVAPVKEEVVEVAPQAVLPPVQQPQQQQEQQQQAPAPVVEKKEEPKVEKKSPEPEAPASGDLEEVCDMTASMIQKIRITTEEEAKAALAERRRLAREQAEREAELERQRLEEEARLEAERLRAEEEEQRRLEEETLRLAQEAREAEEQRLKAAIEEAKKREEEDRKRREEEARQKLEKEEAERKAREEAEKQRLEMVERLKKEEEERNARRKRVEAIMSRTRAKNQASNAQKGEGNDGEKSKEDSPSEENKPGPGDKAAQDLMTASLISEATQQLISNEQRAHHTDSNNLLMDELPSNNGLLRNGGHANGIADSSAKPQQQLLDNEAEELNGHHNNTNHGNGIDGQTIALDNATVKQNNVTNNLLDLSEFDTLSNSNSGPILLMQPSGVVEDSLNSNLNPTAIPFTPSFGMSNQANTNPFQDAFTNNKQDNQVPDLLS